MMGTSITINGRKLVLVLVSSILIVALSVVAFIAGQRTNNSSSMSVIESEAVLSAATSVEGFKPLYFQNNTPPNGLQLNLSSPAYTEGLFFYTLTSASGQKITVAQQKLPDELSASLFQGDENFDTSIGKATISNTTDGRMTGSLVTNEGTLVLINSQDIVDNSLFKSILSSLEPINGN